MYGFINKNNNLVAQNNNILILPTKAKHWIVGNGVEILEKEVTEQTKSFKHSKERGLLNSEDQGT